MPLLKYEFKRGFTIAIIISILVGAICQLSGVYYEYLPDINTIEEAKNQSQEEREYIYAASTEYMNTYNGWLFGFKYYVFIIVFISCIPYSYKYIIDKKTGFLKYYSIRSSKKKIIISKSITNAIIGGLVASISVVVSLLILMAKCTNEIPNKFMPGFGVGSIFEKYLFSAEIYKFIFIAITIMFFIGATYATFSMAIGIITEKVLISILAPQIYWIVGSLMLNSLHLNNLSPWNIFYFWGEANYNVFAIGFLHTAIIFVISSIFILIYSRKDEIS